jgi:hypothetical protein
MRHKRAEFSFHLVLKVSDHFVGFNDMVLKVNIPIVFALAIPNWYFKKERLVHSCGSGEAVAGFFEGAALSCAFGDVCHSLFVVGSGLAPAFLKYI